ncbi:MAG: MFS transporter [Candidatus Verstraetearchaeota archaeon]|nr:MFS transporter [Candidatus Verstraetearchaeota archaeon]
MFEEYRGISRETIYVICSGIMPGAALGMFLADLPYFLTKIYGLTDVFMGTIIFVMGLSMVVTSIPFGMLSDRYGRKNMLMSSNLIFSLVIFIFAVTDNPVILLTAAALSGISEAASSASSNALLADKAGSTKRTPAFALAYFSFSIALGIGSFSIPLVSAFETLGYGEAGAHTALYLLFSVLSFASTAFLLRVNETQAGLKRGGVRETVTIRSKGVLARYTLAGAIIAFGAGMVVPLMTRWFYLQYGILDTVSGPVIGVSDVLIGFATLAAPRIAARFGTVRAIVLTQGMSTLFMFWVPLSPDFFLASVVYTVRSFMMNMSSPLSQSMLMGIVPEEERGIASSITSALWRLPNSFSSIVGAWLFGLGLLSTPFFVAGILYIASIALFWKFFNGVKLAGDN